jgi:hypothetical protein
MVLPSLAVGTYPTAPAGIPAAAVASEDAADRTLVVAHSAASGLCCRPFPRLSYDALQNNHNRAISPNFESIEETEIR